MSGSGAVTAPVPNLIEISDEAADDGNRRLLISDPFQLAD